MPTNNEPKQVVVTEGESLRAIVPESTWKQYDEAVDRAADVGALRQLKNMEATIGRLFIKRALAGSDATPGDKCGQPAASFIPRWGMSFACVLSKGHEGEHRRGGNCFKHGEYVGEKCPQWPNCI